MTNRAFTLRTCQHTGVIAATAAIASGDYPHAL